MGVEGAGEDLVKNYRTVVNGLLTVQGLEMVQQVPCKITNNKRLKKSNIHQPRPYMWPCQSSSQTARKQHLGPELCFQSYDNRSTGSP